MDAVRGKPVVQPHRVRAGREGLRKHVLAFVLRHHGLERCAVFDARFLELVRQRDGLAVVVERHQHGHVFLRPANAELHAVDQPVEHVRRIQVARHQLVAYACPRGLFRRRDLDAVLLVDAQGGCHHHRRAVGQRDEADLQLGLLRRIGASGPGTSTHQRIDQCHGTPSCNGCRGLDDAAALRIDRVDDGVSLVWRGHPWLQRKSAPMRGHVPP